MTDIKPIRAKSHQGVLSADEVAAIQSATLDVLEHVGVSFPSQKALSIFAKHGANVDQEGQIVRLPPDLVTGAMSHAPRSYLLSGRAPGTDLLLDGTRSYFGTDGTGTSTVDFKTRRERHSCKDDIAMMARVADHLASIAFYWPMVSAQDHGRLAPLHEIDAAFNNTVKHVQTETVMGERMAHYAIRMADAVASGRDAMRSGPPLSSLVCTIAPLAQDEHGIEGAMAFAEAGVPVGFMSMPTMGSTAPATAAGALVVGNAELVSAMVLMQLVAPGAPVFYSLCASVLDPRTGGYIVGIPQKYQCNAAGVQLAHAWGVPALAGAFAMDCPEPNTWRMGRDSVYTALLVAQAGADLAEGLGMVRASTLLVPEQILFDDEIYHTHRLLLEGVSVEADSLAVDVIADVGPRGHFLAQRHTRRWVREIWIPELTRPRPPRNGRRLPDIRERARAELDKILAEHKPKPLDKAVQAELRDILNAAEQELGDSAL